MKTGWVGPSKTVEKLEQKICDITGVKYAVSTTSGTMALVMAIKALELPEGSTILFPNYTFLAGANAARFCGLNVQLVDIKEETLCMDPEKVVVDEKVSAIMFVNHNGYVGGDVAKIRDICDENGIAMIEDSSQALGIGDAGTTGDVGVFSFSVPKIVTTGQGGVLFTNNVDIYNRSKRLRDHGDSWRKERLHSHLGINMKFNDILASYGLAQLDELHCLLQLRKKVTDAYRKEIEIIDFGYDSTWMIIYKTENADKIIEALGKSKVQAVKYYKPVSYNPVYQTDEKFPVSEALYEKLVYLPSSLNLTEDQVGMITNIIKEIENE
jgi:perosamine synthetase